MNRRRTLVALATCTAVVLGLAVPAWGHATIDQKAVPANTDQALTLRVPVEPKDHSGAQPDLATRHNERVTVEIPSGFTATACDSKPGWTCKVNPAAGKVPHHVAYTRTGEPYESMDVFTFKVHTAPKPGDYGFQTNQTYSEGDSVHWDGPPDSSTPTPTVQVQ